jgi:hypothetical protein
LREGEGCRGIGRKSHLSMDPTSAGCFLPMPPHFGTVAPQLMSWHAQHFGAAASAYVQGIVQSGVSFPSQTTCCVAATQAASHGLGVVHSSRCASSTELPVVSEASCESGACAEKAEEGEQWHLAVSPEWASRFSATRVRRERRRHEMRRRGKGKGRRGGRRGKRRRRGGDTGPAKRAKGVLEGSGGDEGGDTGPAKRAKGVLEGSGGDKDASTSRVMAGASPM